MNNARFLQLGWVLFAAMAAIALAGGFQAPNEKIGVVDFAKVIDVSDFGKANQDTFARMKTAREEILQFIDNNRVLTIEQATNIRDLSLKPARSKEEDARLESLKADVVAQSKKWQALATKSDMSSEERTLIEDYAKRAQTMGELERKWFNDFQNDLTSWSDRTKIDSISRARAAVQDVAKAQAYTVIFEASVAPYGANDLSDATLTAMNAKK
jgi:Skp family chaperone for outer membrane proteins